MMTTASADRLDRNALMGITAAIGAISAVGMSLGLGMPLLAMVLEQRGVSSSAIGLNTAMAGVVSLLTTPFVPALARKFGAARLLAVMVGLATLTFPLFYVFDEYWMWFPLRFIFNGSINAAFILSEFWINVLAPPRRRGLIMGIYGTVLSLGFAVGPVILSGVGAQGALPFIIGTATLGVSMLPVLAALGSNPSMEQGGNRSFFRYLTLVPLATFAALTMGANESGMLSFLAIYGMRLGFDLQYAALLVTAMVIGHVVSQVPLGMLADRMDKPKLLFLIATVGAGFAALIPAVAHMPLLLFPAIAVMGGATAGLYTVGLTHLGARLTGGDLASANAAFVMMYGLGMLVGPATMGAGMDIYNPHGLAVVSAAFLGAYALLVAYRIWRTGEAKS
jgi:MFS family permease